MLNGRTTLVHINKLLPAAIFLPIQPGNKAPIYRWRKISLEQSSRPRYRRWLAERANTGVVLGTVSGGLCTIDIDRDEAVAEFINLNSDFGSTLCSKALLDSYDLLKELGELW